MQNLLTIAFEAHHQERNHHRRYQISVERDLLDDWTVSICYGRIGQKAHEQSHASSTLEEMQEVIRDRLRRRLSAPKRIGCSYRLAVLSSASGFNAADWLPSDLMAKFF